MSRLISLPTKDEKAESLFKAPSSSLTLVVILCAKNSNMFDEILEDNFSSLAWRIPSLNSYVKG